MKNQNLTRWLSYVIVFTILIILWSALAAAISLTHDNAASGVNQPAGLLDPGNATFGITIGAIILITIIITSAVIRTSERG